MVGPPYGDPREWEGDAPLPTPPKPRAGLGGTPIPEDVPAPPGGDVGGRKWKLIWNPPKREKVPVQVQVGTDITGQPTYKTEYYEDFVPGYYDYDLTDPPKAAAGALYPSGSVTPAMRQKQEWDMAAAEIDRQQRMADLEHAEKLQILAQEWKSAENRKDREQMMKIEKMREKLEQDKQALDGWLGEMRGNIDIRGQNINAAMRAAETAVQARGQDVQQRGQEMGARTALLSEEAANTRWGGDFAMQQAQLRQQGENDRRSDTRGTSELFGYANPEQYDLLQTVQAPPQLPNAPSFQGWNAAAQAVTSQRPRIGPPTGLYPEDPTGGLGPKLNLAPALGMSGLPTVQPPPPVR